MMHAPCTCCGPALSRRGFIASGSAFVALGVAGGAAPVQGAPAPLPPLDKWLAANPNVANAMIWNPGDGAKPYPAWPEPFKAKLRAAFALAWNGTPTRLPDPPPNQSPLTNESDSVEVTLRGEEAFAHYSAYAAGTLATEVGRRVPWSITGYSQTALGCLLDGPQQYGRLTTRPDSYRVSLDGVPPAPETCVEFLRANTLLGPDRRTTIVQMLGWCRDRLTHYAGPRTPSNMEANWQYRGQAPISRVLAGTRWQGTEKRFMPRGDPRRRFTAGCWGTTAVLVSVLRAVNIPARQLSATDTDERGALERHSCVHFAAEELCISHSDDPYSAYCRYLPSFDIGEILVSKQQWDQWFLGRTKPDPSAPRNVGRQPAILAVRHLPIYLLDLYAQDQLGKRGTEAGQVFSNLNGKFSMAELEKAELWRRLEARTVQLGGAQKVRERFAESLKERESKAVATTIN